MNVVLFKNVIGENRPSMKIYSDELIKYMPDNVRMFTIKAEYLPLVRYYLHKEFLYPKAAAKHQGDVNHISDQSYAGLLRYINPKKSVVTCHDLIPLDYRRECSVLGRKRYWSNIKHIFSAAKIVTVSEWTKRCVLRHFNYNRRDVEVIYEGVSEAFKVLDDRDKLKKKYGIEQGAILHVGTSFPRKNVELILNVLCKMQEAVLLKVGSFTKGQRDFIKAFDLCDRVKEFCHVSRSILVELYNIADVLFMPSVAEGFGLPVLEAMACGCPVVCSNIDVFHELYEGAVIFADTNDICDAVDKISAVLRHSNVRAELAGKALLKSREFSWQECARRTYRIYENIYYEK